MAGLLFSTGGAAVKACTFSAWQIAGLRSAIAAVVMLVCVPGARQRPRRLLSLLGVGIAYAATLTLYVSANKHTTAANAIFLQSTAPLYLLALGPLLLREVPRRVDILVAGLVACGMTAILLGADTPNASAPNPGFGNMLGACAGVTWAFTILGMRGLGRRDPSAAASAVVLGNLLTLGVALPAGWPMEAGTAVDWAWLVYLGVAQVGVAYVLVTRATPSLPAVQISLLLMIEPALNPLIAWMVHGEVPSAASIAGGGIIVFALCLQARGKRSAMQG